MVGVQEVASYIENPQFKKKKESPYRYNYNEEKTKEKVDMQMMVMKETEDQLKEIKEQVSKIDIKTKTKIE